MPTGGRNDPYSNFNFRVDIDGITVAGSPSARAW